MTKNEVGKHLLNDDFPFGIAEIICDIAVNNEVVYPNESILVIVYDKDDSVVNDDQIDTTKHWTICESIDDFIDGMVYGKAKADEVYCKHYVSDFKEVKAFETDF